MKYRRHGAKIARRPTFTDFLRPIVTSTALPAALLLNFFEYRTGVWLPKAYVVGLDDSGQPRVVHQSANPGSVTSYGVVADAHVIEVLSLADSLRDRNIAEHFRRGSKKTPVLAALIADRHKEQEAVLRYLHARSAALLEVCRTQGYFVTLNLDIRSSPLPHLLRFAARPWVPRLRFDIDEKGVTYRLQLQAPGGEAQLVRHLDPRILTNRPAPGWIVVGNELVRLQDLRGDALRPFLTRDTVHIEPASVGKYLREFVSRAVRRHELAVTGLELTEIDAPTGLLLHARPHPFSDHYHLYPEFRYGKLLFALGELEQIKVTHTTAMPYSMLKATRDPVAEERLLQPLLDLGLGIGEGGRTLSTATPPGPYSNLRWLLDHEAQLIAEGVEVDLPELDGKPLSRLPAYLDLSAEATGDWLDLKGKVTVGDHTISFARLVKQLRSGERRFELPDGEVLLLPEDWFTTYAPGLELARVTGERVKLTRSQAPLLRGMGVAAPEPPSEPLAPYTAPASLHATLRPYQLAGVRWLVSHHHDRMGACLADDMGLGKTLQTIAVLLYAKELGATSSEVTGKQIDLFAPGSSDEAFLQPLRALVVLPSSLLYNWAEELRRFAPSLTVHTNVGTKRLKDARVLRRFDVVLTTYQTALRDRDTLAEIDLTYIVLDESQQIKNRQSKVFRALDSLSVPHRVSLSGTPIENSLSDLWSQMQFINPGLLGTFPFFRRQFLQPIEQHDDEVRKDQLRQLVAPYLLRRTKAEVAPELPELDVQICYCEMSKAQAGRYARERSAARNALLGTGESEEGGNRIRIIQALTRLRQLANHPRILDPDYDKDSGKFNEVIAQWDVVRRSGHKVLVFSTMVRQLELFRDHLRELGQPYAWLTGSVPSEKRAEEVRRFQTDPAVQTFLISITAGGTGLNLTAADYVFILDPWWNPTTEDQAIARAHRIGRSGNVFARKFITQGTLEEKIHRLQQRKKRLSQEIIDREATLAFDAEEIEFLLN